MPGSRMLQRALLPVVLGLTGPGLAHGAVITWNFNSPGGAVASPHVYFDTSNTYSITAYGYTTENASPASAIIGQTWGFGGGFNFNTGAIASHSLYGKTSTPDETGLGLDGLDPDHEIQVKSFVQLDLANLLANQFLSMTAIIASVQKGEGYEVWGSNVLGTPGALLYKGRNPNTGGDVQSFAVPQFGTFRYVAVSASAVDILIGNGLSAVTPEPAALTMLLVGGLAALRRRNR